MGEKETRESKEPRERGVTLEKLDSKDLKGVWGFLAQEVTLDNQECLGRMALLETQEILGREEIWVPLEIRVTKAEVGSAIQDQEDQQETWE